MILHKRWLCHECKREWIDPKNMVNSSRMTITGNKRDDLCPICGSGQIEYVEYHPQFLGGDIPRPDMTVILPIAADTGEEVKSIEQGAPGFVHNQTIGMIKEK